MANIDTSMIEGFDGMTADEKVTALLGLQIPDPVDLSGYVKKDVFDAKATEAASLAKQLKTKTVEAETATGTLSTTQAELEAIKRSYYVASKGLTGDDAEFIAFKAGKMVDDIVILNDDGTWTAIYGTPKKEATFPTEGQATLYIKAHTAPATPIIVIDV